MFTTTIKKDKKAENSFEVKFQGMTAGKIIALERALANYSEQSAVCNDVFQSLEYAISLSPEAKHAMGN